MSIEANTTTSVHRYFTEPQNRRRVHEQAGHRCQVNVEGCRVMSVHAHHILRRSQGGGYDLANLLAVCWHCHDYIHAHPAESYAAGWLQRRHPRPGDHHYRGDDE